VNTVGCTRTASYRLEITSLTGQAAAVSSAIIATAAHRTNAPDPRAGDNPDRSMP
jgi:hypothetical protein